MHIRVLMVVTIIIVVRIISHSISCHLAIRVGAFVARGNLIIDFNVFGVISSHHKFTRI